MAVDHSIGGSLVLASIRLSWPISNGKESSESILGLCNLSNQFELC